MLGSLRRFVRNDSASAVGEPIRTLGGLLLTCEAIAADDPDATFLTSLRMVSFTDSPQVARVYEDERNVGSVSVRAVADRIRYFSSRSPKAHRLRDFGQGPPRIVKVGDHYRLEIDRPKHNPAPSAGFAVAPDREARIQALEAENASLRARLAELDA